MLMETYPDEIDSPNPAFANALSVKLGNGMIFAIVGTVCMAPRRYLVRSIGCALAYYQRTPICDTISSGPSRRASSSSLRSPPRST